MPNQPNELYSVQKTTIWFALASIALTVSLVLMVLEDYNREWKTYQKEFVELERERVQKELEHADKKETKEYQGLELSHQ